MSVQTPELAEDLLRASLADSEAESDLARKVLSHRVVSRDDDLFDDEVIARIRGMLDYVARQLVHRLATVSGADRKDPEYQQLTKSLTEALLRDPALLQHAHALALEARLADRLHRRSGIDVVLAPLLQQRASSRDQTLISITMALLASQARFVMQSRRMELPLKELPGELFHEALQIFRAECGDLADHAESVVGDLREEFGESGSRLGLLARFVSALGMDATQAMAIDHAGIAIFATALAMASGQERDIVVLSLADRQSVRLAVSLRAAGLKNDPLEAQLRFLRPDSVPPQGIEGLRKDRAAMMLASAAEAGEA